MIRGEDGRITGVRYVLPRHKAANWVGSGPWSADRLGRARAGPRRMRRDSDVARRTARDRHSQPLTGSHVMARTAREKGGFKDGLRRRDKSGLERG